MRRWGMAFSGVAIIATSAAIVPTTAEAAAAPKPPAVSVTVEPEFVGCRKGQRPATVTVSWRIVHDVTSATLSGTVNKRGKDLGPLALPTTAGKNGVVGSRKIHVRCTATAQVVLLTATGAGGTTTATSSVRENRAD